MSDQELLRICAATLRQIEVRGEYAEALAGVINALDSMANQPDAHKTEPKKKEMKTDG